ncbi:discoidin domain-containing protein [Haloferula sargassicola]|uniref:discoidin domain-containing protein n=1 Tax=Haloferula sargassicola TaxID=490096 RepID=UPI003365AB7C
MFRWAIAWGGVTAASGQLPGLDAPVPIGGFANGVFPVSPPGTASGWQVVNAFPALTFVDPLWLAEVPGADELLVVGKSGQLWRFPKDPEVAAAEVVEVLDWREHTQFSEDQGFYSAVFHPRFGPATGEVPYVFVCYNHRPALAGADANHSYWRVSRFTWDFATGTLDPASEFVLMNQYDRCRWHNGGAMFFDNEGFLNITCGDGGDSSQGGGLTGPDGALSRTQRLDGGLFSGLFRIDVDNDPSRSHPIRRQPASPTNKPAGWPPSETKGYGIPNDNPWQDPAGGVLEEYASLGWRSPHTAHYDAVAGEVWVGDVGEGSREEMTRATAGDNAQWGYREGDIGGPAERPAELIGNDRPPFLVYPRSVGSCIIGGMRYRGAKWQDLLGGKILFGDHARGRVWTASVEENTPPVMEEIVAGLPTGDKAGLANFCTDASGEVYLMMVNGTNQSGGTIRKLTTAGISSEPPALLSQTGVFTNLATLETAPGVIPYEVANPLWSDGAAKQRWVILPNDGTHDSAAEDIVFSEKGNWVFPAGTVFVKHFEVSLSEIDPSQVKRLETRFLVCTENGGKYGMTYKWNEAGTDAELLAGGLSEAYEVVSAAGVTETRNWDYPSRGDCLLCHNPAAGQALGFRTAQLNRPHLYPSTGRTANQLATFNSLGMFDRTLTAEELADYIEARPLDDTTAPLEHRVRSYLDSNCSHCHRPGGQFEGFDARLGTPLQQQGLIDAVLRGNFDLGPDGRYIKPGDPSLSALHVRLAAVGDGNAMPPLAKNVVDDKAVTALNAWINGLDPAEFETIGAPQARYVRLVAWSEVNGNPWTTVGEFTILDGNGDAVPAASVDVSDFDSEELVGEFAPASNAVDDDPDTYWHTEWSASTPSHPHQITLDLGSSRELGGYVYTPRQDFANGRIADYQVSYSLDASTWTVMDEGTWPDSAAVQRFDGLVARRPARCQIAGPQSTVDGSFEVSIVFDTDVAGFDASGIQVTGGGVSDLRGSGYYYVATISPVDPTVQVSVATDAVNPSGVGSLASETLSFHFIDTLPPVPVFTGVPSQVAGPFQIGLGFGEPVSGLEAADFSIVNGRLDAISPDGDDYRLTVTPDSEGLVAISILPGAVVDAAANVMVEGTTVSVLYLEELLARNAGEASFLGGGMAVVPDAAAPHGEYLWLPEGGYPGNFDPPVKTDHRAEYGFVIRRAGDYRLRGLIRSTDASSDSFWVEIDGSQALGDVYLWDTQPVGAPDYQWDYLSDRNGADPVVLNLAEGARVVTVYGRDDGTRLDRLELESVRPLATLSGPPGSVGGAFTAGLVFSEPVSGLDPTDFTIHGGVVTAVTGGGSSYFVDVSPSATPVSLVLPADVVTDGEGALNFASNSISVTYLTPYLQWAQTYGVDGSAASLLADEDGDGVAKLLEFAFGLRPDRADGHVDDPAVSPPSGLPVAEMVDTGENARLALRFLRRKDMAGLIYEAQFGPTPGSFSPATGAPVVESIDATWERVTVSDSESIGTSAARFGRVKVSYPSP